MSNFKPLLASPVEFDKLDFSNLWISPKLDGIRAVVIDGVVLSRKLLPIPNEYVQELFGHSKFNGLDGELIVGDPNAKDVYNRTYSGVMKKVGEPEVVFHAFDHFEFPKAEYKIRYEFVCELTDPLHTVKAVAQSMVTSMRDLEEIEEKTLDLGYEGVMLRAYHGPKSHYKFGRSTAKEGTLLKLKRFSDSTAKIVGVEEEMENRNEMTRDELGNAKRSSHQDNKVGKGTLGALVCETPEGVRFNIGTGFTAYDRAVMWTQRDELIGKYCDYKHFAVGAIEAPRFPVFLRLRSALDM